MSNFFAALDSDSDEDVRKSSTSAGKKTVQSKKTKPRASRQAVETSRTTTSRGGRNENKKRSGRGGKREYDRRSGTGRGREIKKGGAGGHNWGKAGEETMHLEEDVEKDNEEVAAEADAEPEVVEKTLEEYFAEKAALRQGDAFEQRDDIEVEEVKDGKQYSKKDKQSMDVEVSLFMPFSDIVL